MERFRTQFAIDTGNSILHYPINKLFHFYRNNLETYFIISKTLSFYNNHTAKIISDINIDNSPHKNIQSNNISLIIHNFNNSSIHKTQSTRKSNHI